MTETDDTETDLPAVATAGMLPALLATRLSRSDRSINIFSPTWADRRDCFTENEIATPWQSTITQVSCEAAPAF